MVICSLNVKKTNVAFIRIPNWKLELNSYGQQYNQPTATTPRILCGGQNGLIVPRSFMALL